MENKKDGNRVSISAIRKANDNMIGRSTTNMRMDGNISGGRVVVRTVYSGRKYEINLSPADIKKAYSQSIENAKSVAK
jgi:hypothetical protein